MPTFPELLTDRLRRTPSAPFVTFYDDASGERTELSVITYANWVSKTANLFVDELMLDPGDAVHIDLPTHWLGAVFLGGLLCAGLDLADSSDGADVAIIGPDALADPPAATTLMACSLRPFAVRFAEPLPDGVLDHGVLWAGQSDVFSPEAPTALDPEPDDRRVITDLSALTAPGQHLLLGLLAGAGSLVLLRNAGDDAWSAHSRSERTTAAVRATR